MRHYEVIFSEDAIADLASSIQWGCANWGEDETWRWYRETRGKILRILSAAPLSQPIAPDDDEYEVSVRQMNIGRYRILFNVSDDVVTILHVRGPYTGQVR